MSLRYPAAKNAATGNWTRNSAAAVRRFPVISAGIRSSYAIIRSLRSPFRMALIIATMLREPLLAQRTEFGHLDAAPP